MVHFPQILWERKNWLEESWWENLCEISNLTSLSQGYKSFLLTVEYATGPLPRSFGVHEEPEALHYLLSLIAPCLVTLQPRLEQLPSSGFLWDLQKDFYSYFLFIICMSAHFGPNTEERGSLLRSSVLAFQLGGQEGLPRNITVALNPRGSKFAISVLNSRCT